MVRCAVRRKGKVARKIGARMTGRHRVASMEASRWLNRTAPEAAVVRKSCRERRREPDPRPFVLIAANCASISIASAAAVKGAKRSFASRHTATRTVRPSFAPLRHDRIAKCGSRPRLERGGRVMSTQAMAAGCSRILIVGNFILRRGIASIVSGLVDRASIAEAPCFHDGKARLRSEEFSAAIFDVDREDQNGPVDFQMLRADHPQLILAVLARLDNVGAILRYLAAGVNGYILERSSQSEIERAIGAVLNRAPYVPPHLMRYDLGQPAPDSAVAPICRNFRGLTGRQGAVLRLLLSGCSNKEIARVLDLSPHTVKIHVGALLRHFAVQRRSDLLMAASRNHDSLATYAAARRNGSPRSAPMRLTANGASVSVAIGSAG